MRWFGIVSLLIPAAESATESVTATLPDPDHKPVCLTRGGAWIIAEPQVAPREGPARVLTAPLLPLDDSDDDSNLLHNCIT